MARKQNPITRFYEIRPKSGWARIWLTDDGCISIISDHGTFGYWFGSPGCEFREFLLDCGDDYLGGKFSRGKTEFDGEATVDLIRERILHLRRHTNISRGDARREWEKLPTVFDSPEDFSSWVCESTHIRDAYELSCYVTPWNVQHFLKHQWPLFVAQLKAELDAEQTQQVASGT